MNPYFFKNATSMLLAFSAFASPLQAQTTSPREWIDADTGHRVVQLSTEPGSESLYFNLNPFTPDGQKMVITSPEGISLIHLQTRAVERIVSGRPSIIMVGRKTGQIYYISRKIENGATIRSVCAIDPKTRAVREILKLARGQEVSTVNADETLLGGTLTERPEGDTSDRREAGSIPKNDIESANLKRGKKSKMMEDRLAKRYPMALFFFNIATGETKTVNRCNDWLGHLQFSPTDPNLLMFCHEGLWQKVDRIWTIRSDGSDLKLIHRRTMIMEIAGHEFWSADGKTIWYDLQTPRSETFWIAGYEVSSGDRTWYRLERNEWSVHFNVSPDQTLFSGDGGDEHMVAHAKDGKWLYLFRPERLADKSDGNIDTQNLIQTGVLHSEKLVNLGKHDYALEPNAMFSPDMKWLIFRSNMSGANQAYAVELAKAERK